MRATAGARERRKQALRGKTVDPRRVLAHLRRLGGSPADIAGMARFGIRSERVLGIPVPKVRAIARELGPDHPLALKLWRTGIHEARLLAAMIAVPSQLSESDLERWVRGLDNWAICDGCCQELFHKTRFARRKIREWSRREPEYEKRAAFALIAELAVHDRRATDREFAQYLDLVEREASDPRPYVKKGVNWALRQVGKRNLSLNRSAIAAARRIRRQPSSAARWIASDALRELTGPTIQARLRERRRDSGPRVRPARS